MVFRAGSRTQIDGLRSSAGAKPNITHPVMSNCPTPDATATKGSDRTMINTLHLLNVSQGFSLCHIRSCASYSDVFGCSHPIVLSPFTGPLKPLDLLNNMVPIAKKKQFFSYNSTQSWISHIQMD